MPVEWRTPPPLGFKIHDVWAYIGTDEHGTEGIPAVILPGTDTWLPMIAADVTRLDDLRPHAEQIARAGGRPLALARFTNRSDCGLILP